MAMAAGSAAIATAFLGAGALWAISWRFRRRLPARVPMQWSLTGRPTWYARRGIALAFTPVLGTLVLIAMAIATAWGVQTIDESDPLPWVALTGVVLCAIHAGHLAFAARDS